jgi:hypothetical protein
MVAESGKKADDAMRHALADFYQSLVRAGLGVGKHVDAACRPIQDALLMETDEVLPRDVVGREIPRSEYSLAAYQDQLFLGFGFRHSYKSSAFDYVCQFFVTQRRRECTGKTV